jgi:uncharacterized cupin superfamily protein
VVHVSIVEAITGVKIAKRNQPLATNAGREDTYKNFVIESHHIQKKTTEEITEDLKIGTNTLQEVIASPCTRTQKLNTRKREWSKRQVTSEETRI